MEKIKIEEILKRHNTLGVYQLTGGRLQAAIKEIVEAVVDKCKELAEVEDTHTNKVASDVYIVNEESILQVKNQIDYD